ncbi:MAG TPA: cytochrome c [Pyrinomonadaceae bacterium]|jgi:mono/diheme cytochrome c family protein
MMRLCSLVFIVFFIGVLGTHANSNKERSAAQLYRKYCVSCHGTDGRAKTSKGKFNHARDLTNPEWHDDVTDERIFNSIMNGRDVAGTMPPFSNKINQKEAELLVNFVRKLRG